MPYIHGGSPISWTDALAPAFASGSGAAAPSYTTDFIAATGAGGSDANELRLPTFTAGTNDRVYATIQIPHDIYVPSAGSIVIKPHVHWTFVSEPTTGQTVIWEAYYVYTKPNGTFASSVSTATMSAYTTTSDPEVRKHIISSLSDITVAAADAGLSMIFIFTLKLKSTSTIDAAKVALLSFDVHYQILPRGSNEEFA